ncbi:MAG: SEC-C metal-binding domain-containing protein [Bacillota bacterium]|nr:SEC-C metal-binding domain-containing protein [Bacillota bacterium]
MAYTNKYGLSRDINEPIKREIRQRCGFGCIICGSAVYQYEHVDPPFAEAKVHDPNSIVLLCGGCHDRVTRGLLSKDTIKIKSANPKCKEQGFSFGPFDLGTISPEIVIGTFKGKNVKTLISIHGDDIFSVHLPTSSELPFLISAKLCDRDGKEILKISNNEWQTPSNNWDVEVIGTRITIRKKLGDILLVIRSEPPYRLIVEKMDMEHKGTRICCKEGENIEVTTSSGQIFKSSETVVSDCKVGIQVTSEGLALGVGCGSVYIDNATFSSVPPSRLLTLPPNKMYTKPEREKKVGRNEKCPCRSGIKFKKCCGYNKY